MARHDDTLTHTRSIAANVSYASFTYVITCFTLSYMRRKATTQTHARAHTQTHAHTGAGGGPGVVGGRSIAPLLDASRYSVYLLYSNISTNTDTEDAPCCPGTASLTAAVLLCIYIGTDASAHAQRARVTRRPL